MAPRAPKKGEAVILPRGIRQKENGSFLVDVTKDGVRKTAVARTLEAALILRERMKADAEVGRGLHALPSTPKGPERSRRPWTLQDAFDRTLDAHWRGSDSEKTAVINANSALEFFKPDALVGDITTGDIDLYVAHLLRTNVSDGTINRKLSALSRILRTAEERGQIATVPKMPRRKERQGRIRFLTPTEEDQLLKWFIHLNKTAHHEATIILIDTGFRTGELWGVTAEHVDFIQGTYGAIILWKTKNNRPRTVPMTYRVREIITKRVRDFPNGPLFPEAGKDWFRIGWDKVRALMHKDEDPEFVPHMLRHTCCSRLVQRGVPLVHVQKWMGHLAIQTTMRYAHLAPDDLFSAAAVLDGGEYARWGQERKPPDTVRGKGTRKPLVQ